MRTQFDDLQRQLSTGQKSATYAGLGIDRGVTRKPGMHSCRPLQRICDNTIDNVNTRIGLMNTVLSNMSTIGSTVKSAMVQANGVGSGDGSGAAIAQQTANSSLDPITGPAHDTQAGDRYLFFGPCDLISRQWSTLDHILNGNGAQAGLKQLTAGAQIRRILVLTGLVVWFISAPTATSVAVAEDSTSPFGLKVGFDYK